MRVHTVARLIGIGVLVVATLLGAVLVAQEPRSDGPALLAGAGCTGCHGAAGRGTVAAPPIAGPALALDEFRRAVRTGRGVMPAYPVEVLPEARLAAIYTYTSDQEGIAMPVGRVAAGGRLYEQSGCYSCHSNQGQGGTQGPRIGPGPVRWGKFVWYLRHPTAQMPPYSSSVLPDQELADIYAFLEVRPQPRPVAEIPLLAP